MGSPERYGGGAAGRTEIIVCYNGYMVYPLYIINHVLTNPISLEHTTGSVSEETLHYIHAVHSVYYTYALKSIHFIHGVHYVHYIHAVNYVYYIHDVQTVHYIHYVQTLQTQGVYLGPG